MRQKKREPFCYQLDTSEDVYDDDGNLIHESTKTIPLDKNMKPIKAPKRSVSAKEVAKRRKRKKIAKQSQKRNRI